jgi:hypothetical protein
VVVIAEAAAEAAAVEAAAVEAAAVEAAAVEAADVHHVIWMTRSHSDLQSTNISDQTTNWH